MVDELSRVYMSTYVTCLVCQHLQLYKKLREDDQISYSLSVFFGILMHGDSFRDIL